MASTFYFLKGGVTACLEGIPTDSQVIQYGQGVPGVDQFNGV